MKKRYLLILLLSFGLAHAAVPANDECVDAIELTPGLTCSSTGGNTQDATLSPPSTCVSAIFGDVWYKFTATTADATISVTGSTNFDAVVELHGTCDGSNRLACVDFTANDNTENLNAQSLSIGTVYYIRVSSYGSAAPGSFDFTICVVEIPLAPNDLCTNATLLSTSVGSCGAYSNGYLSITGTGTTGCNGDATDDVWYSFVATGSAMNIDVNADFDVVIESYSGACGTLTSIGCANAESTALYGLTVNETYYFRVYDYFETIPSNKNFTVCVYEILVPSNDDCANAISITPEIGVCSSPYNGTLLGATGTGGCTGDANDDVWYKFTANGTSMVVNVSSSFSTVIEVQSTCGGTVLACVNNNSVQVNGLSIGTEYFVRVYDYYTMPTSSPLFTICAYSVSPPANDNCSSPTSLVVGNAPVSSTLLGSTSEVYAACQGYSDDDVWFSFTATSTSHAVKITNASFSPVISLYLTCGGSVIACSDNPSLSASSLNIGNTYLVRVHSLGDNTVSNPYFEIAVFTPIANDDCSNAISLTMNAPPLTASSSDATQSYSPCTGYSEDDVWFTYTPSVASGDTIEVVGSVNYDAIVQMFDGCPGSSMNCSDGTASGGTEQYITSGLNISQPYYIRVYDFSSIAPLTTDFTIRVKNGLITSNTSAVDDNAYNVFPNPTSGELSINNLSSGTTLELYTIQGTLLYTQTATSANVSIDVKSLANGKGMYHLRLSNGENVVVKKIILN